MVSYLPLSHVAAQIIDIVGAVMSSSTLYFAGVKFNFITKHLKYFYYITKNVLF
jgi:hypothetical protein